MTLDAEDIEAIAEAVARKMAAPMSQAPANADFRRVANMSSDELTAWSKENLRRGRELYEQARKAGQVVDAVGRVRIGSVH